MRNPSDSPPKEGTLRDKLIGLGEDSHRKSYYPELQKRLAELERFKTFLDHSNDAIFLIEVPSAGIVDLNESACRQLGRKRRELLKRSIFDVSDLGSHPELRELICDVGECEKARTLVEASLHPLDGERIAIEMTLSRMFFEDSAYVIAVARDITKRKRAEEALRQSEIRRYKLQTQLEVAAQVQKKLLPQQPPQVSGFEFAARCLPAQHVGGDFYDWQQTAPGRLTLTLGDVMGKGMPAAMVMATVRAALRSVSQANSPATALALAEQALHEDLDNSDSFVTLFHAQLDVYARTITYVDCGHGFVFLRRVDGAVVELFPRGMPFGLPFHKNYQEGSIAIGRGDALVIFTDGLIDALPETEIDNETLAKTLTGADGAQEMVERLITLVPRDSDKPDDLTVLVAFCSKGG